MFLSLIPHQKYLVPLLKSWALEILLQYFLCRAQEAVPFINLGDADAVCLWTHVWV